MTDRNDRLNLTAMAPSIRDLLADVSDDAELLRRQGHGAAADRAMRRAERLSALADDLEGRVDAMPRDGWAALNETLEQLQREMAEKSANVGALLREIDGLHAEIKQAVAAKHGKVGAA